jgi:hypothetical protein
MENAWLITKTKSVIRTKSLKFTKFFKFFSYLFYMLIRQNYFSPDSNQKKYGEEFIREG